MGHDGFIVTVISRWHELLDVTKIITKTPLSFDFVDVNQLE